MVLPINNGLRGMGSGEPVLGPTLNTSIASGGSIGVAAFMGTSLAVPIIGAAIAGITLAIGLFLNRAGPKQKTATSNYVNEIEPLMRQNIAAWRASDKTASEQVQALANFDSLWAMVLKYCNQESMGDPGKNCVADRVSGGKWDWFSYYRDPIANDPEVVPDATVSSAGSAGEGALSTLGIPGVIGGIPTGELLIPVALVAVIILMST